MTKEKEKTEEELRTEQQNKALHLYFTWVAETLNEAGLDMRAVLPPVVMLEWDKNSVKKKMWKPIQEALLDTSSTTELKKLEDIERVFDHVNREILAPKGIHVPFPSIKELMLLMLAKEEELKQKKSKMKYGKQNY